MAEAGGWKSISSSRIWWSFESQRHHVTEVEGESQPNPRCGNPPILSRVQVHHTWEGVPGSWLGQNKREWTSLWHTARGEDENLGSPKLQSLPRFSWRTPAVCGQEDAKCIQGRLWRTPPVCWDSPRHCILCTSQCKATCGLHQNLPLQGLDQ